MRQRLELGLLVTRNPLCGPLGLSVLYRWEGATGAPCILGATAITPLLTLLAPVVSEPDRAWEPVSQPGAGVSLGAHSAAPGPQPLGAPRPRGLPHPAGLRALRYVGAVLAVAGCVQP